MRVLRTAAMSVVLAMPLSAQAIRLHVTEQQTNRPLGGVVMDVLDASGAVSTQALLADDGTRVVPVGKPGSYTIRVRRIGYAPFTSEPVTVTGRETVTAEIVAPSRRVVLEAVNVTARRCARDAMGDPGLSSLWEQIRTALTSSVLSRTDSSAMFEVRSFRRTLSPNRDVRAQIVGPARATRVSRPYAARPVEELAELGYVRMAENTDFFAPDEQVLLSERFVADHCFEVVRGTDETEGLLGIRFTPAPRRNMNDIAGTMWVEQASAELKFLDFFYVLERLPSPAQGPDRSGGQVVFGRRPDGRWLVTAWRLRMPEFDKGRRITYQSNVNAYNEFGGVVSPAPNDTSPITAVERPYLELLEPSIIRGVVYDSLRNRALTGARVWLVPITNPAEVALDLLPSAAQLATRPVEATVAADGRYQLPPVPAGTYRLGFESPAIDSLGLRPTRYDIQLKSGTLVAANMFIPSMAGLSATCEGAPGGPGRRGVIVGVVRSAIDERPLVDAQVRGDWVEISSKGGVFATAERVAEGVSDSLGVYRLCGIPDSVIVKVRAAGPHSSTSPVPATLGPLGVARLNLMLAESDDSLPVPPGTVVGTVSDSLGRPVTGATVNIEALQLSTRTDSSGRFRLANVLAGTQTLEVRRIGSNAVERPVDVRSGAITEVSVAIVRAQLLERMVVTADRTRSSPEVQAAVVRTRSGFGHLLLSENFPPVNGIAALMRDIPNVRVGGSGISQIVLLHQGAGDCAARPFVDRREVSDEEFWSLSNDDIAAIEVYVRPATAPIWTAGRSMYGRSETCGVLVITLKR